MVNHEHYESFFENQIGYGLSDVGPYMRINRRTQRGGSVGSVLKSLWSMLSPYLVSSGKAIGAEALRGGSEVLSKLGTDSVANLVKHQQKKSFENLTSKAEDRLKRMRESRQSGSGIKRKRAKLTRTIKQLITAGRSIKSSRKPRTKSIKKKSFPKKRGRKSKKRTDIFG